MLEVSAQVEHPEHEAWAREYPNTDKSEKSVEQEIREAIRGSFSNSDCARIGASFHELLRNARTHGSALYSKGGAVILDDWGKPVPDPEKPFKVAFSKDKNYLRIEVEDGGEGFVRDDVPDPTTEENRERTDGGRGLRYIESFAKHVHRNDKGNRTAMLWPTSKSLPEQEDGQEYEWLLDTLRVKDVSFLEKGQTVTEDSVSTNVPTFVSSSRGNYVGALNRRQPQLAHAPRPPDQNQ